MHDIYVSQCGHFDNKVTLNHDCSLVWVEERGFYGIGRDQDEANQCVVDVWLIRLRRLKTRKTEREEKHPLSYHNAYSWNYGGYRTINSCQYKVVLQKDRTSRGMPTSMCTVCTAAQRIDIIDITFGMFSTKILATLYRLLLLKGMWWFSTTFVQLQFWYYMQMKNVTPLSIQPATQSHPLFC